MKRTLSFLKPVASGVKTVGEWALLIWRAGRFGVFPSSRNLLVSFWYDFVYYKKLRSEATVLTFLDQRIAEWPARLLEEKSPYKRRLREELFRALQDPSVRQVLIGFLESPDPEANYEWALYSMRSAWRRGGQEGLGTNVVEIGWERPELSEVKTGPAKADPGASEVKIEDVEVEAAGVNAKTGREEGKSTAVDTPHLHAKTYVIATEIHFELANKPAEYKRLSDYPPDLAKFVQEQFGAARLPRNFRKLKGYSYKEVLEERNDAKLGQLKPHFRQIIGNPEIFGPAIVKRAQRILDDHFL
jgi:hypothetical protein